MVGRKGERERIKGWIEFIKSKLGIKAGYTVGRKGEREKIQGWIGFIESK